MGIINYCDDYYDGIAFLNSLFHFVLQRFDTVLWLHLCLYSQVRANYKLPKLQLPECILYYKTIVKHSGKENIREPNKKK